jgi:hypothetical protein
MNNGICLVVALALLTGIAHASEYNGPIAAEGLRFSTGTSPARVSISVGNVATPCAVKNFYAYEDATSGLAGLWTAALTQARIHGRTIKIVGTGICDGFGVEGILYLDLK